MRLCDFNDTAKGRIKGMVELRKIVNELIDYQLNDYSDEDIKAKQKELDIAYDEFSSKYGLLNSRANSMHLLMILPTTFYVLLRTLMKTEILKARQICSPKEQSDRKSISQA